LAESATEKGWQADPEARQARLAELRGQFGAAQNAEQLIAASRAARDPEIDAASLKAIDPEATKDLDLSEVEVPEGHTVQDAAVRGGYLIAVVEDEQGNFYKTGQPHAETYKAPSAAAADKALREQQKIEAQAREENLEAQAEIELKVDEYRKQLQAEAAEESAQRQEEAAEAVQEAQQEAAAEAEEAAPPTRTTRGRRRTT
jgi:hypothetical protein